MYKTILVGYTHNIVRYTGQAEKPDMTHILANPQVVLVHALSIEQHI